MKFPDHTNFGKDMSRRQQKKLARIFIPEGKHAQSRTDMKKIVEETLIDAENKRDIDQITLQPYRERYEELVSILLKYRDDLHQLRDCERLLAEYLQKLNNEWSYSPQQLNDMRAKADRDLEWRETLSAKLRNAPEGDILAFYNEMVYLEPLALQLKNLEGIEHAESFEELASATNPQKKIAWRKFKNN